MLDKTLSSIRSEKRFSDWQEAQDIVDRYFKAAVLTSQTWSKRRRSRLRPTRAQFEVSTKINWRDIGQALRARFLERVGERCECHSCRSQDTKRGRREMYWISAIGRAETGNP